MTQLNYRANLSAAVFPMTIAKAGRSVIIPQADQNFDRRIDAPGDSQRGSVGIPQIIYGENILPTPDGFQSVGFKPRTAIALASSTITAITPVKVATVVTTEEVTVGGAILYNSTGNDLSAWEVAADNVPPNGISEVTQESSGGNPGDNFNLYSDVNASASAGYMPSYPWIRKSFSVGNPTNAGFELDFNFTYASIGSVAIGTEAPTVVVGIFNSAANAGLQVKLNYEANTIAFGTGTSILGAGFAAIDTDTPSSALTSGNLYRLEVTLAKVSADPLDQNRAVTVVLKNSFGTTIATLTGFYAVALVSYCSVAFVSDIAENTLIPDPDTISLSVAVDNIDVTGDGAETTTTYTEFTGLETIYVAWRANDTAVWSYSLDAFNNFEVIEPVGFESPANPNKVSVANVRGVTYICVREALDTTKIYVASIDTVNDELDLTDVTATIDATLPNGYSIDSILGIVSSYNYLILFTGGTVLWSSTTTPTDFAPSLVSGAGNEVPGNLKGDIVFAKEHLAGFFLYSTKNVLFVAYTGNQRYPWRFREVGQSGGFNYSTQVSGDTNSSVQYGINNSKFIQILNQENAELVAPEVTDLLERTKRWDNFNSATFVFTLSDSTFALIPSTKPTAYFVLDRYLFLPYGMSDADTNLQWTYVLVYDLLLKRYGKLKILHDFCLSDEENTFFINRLTGAINKLYFDILDYSLGEVPYEHAGVIVLGKFQLSRDRFISLDELTIDAVQNIDELADPADRNITIRILPSLDGRSFEAPVTPYDETDETQNLDGLQLLTRVSCQNFAIAILGAFDLNTVALTFHAEGDS